MLYEQKYQDGELRQRRPRARRRVLEPGQVASRRLVRVAGRQGRGLLHARKARACARRSCARRSISRASVPIFNPARRHPISGIVRAHKGVDYAAPTGTPIWAAGEGRIQFAGRKGGYGNVVMIDHGKGISTVYGHMSRFGKSARAGRHRAAGRHHRLRRHDRRRDRAAPALRISRQGRAQEPVDDSVAAHGNPVRRMRPSSATRPKPRLRGSI